ncbi:MAG: hypothetical protein ABFD79_12695 [Phycisphaerales bacterium]
MRLLKWNKLKKDENGYYFNVWPANKSGDTEERPLRVIFSEPYLLNWMKDYPGQIKDEYYVFCKLDNPTIPNITWWGIMSDMSVANVLQVPLGQLKQKKPTNITTCRLITSEIAGAGFEPTTSGL